MPSKHPKFITGELYHVFNRGVEKREIFLETSDFFRFISCLYELNEKGMIKMRDRIEDRLKRKKYTSTEIHTGDTCVSRSRGEALVEVIAFCLMPNHYHLVLRQLVDGGNSLFMKKLGNSYVGYFNEKRGRKGMGSLFQGSFKAVHIENEEQFIGLICYIFSNPVEILEKDWKETGSRNSQKAMQFLKSYRWSSFLDCVGIPNFPSVTKKDFIMDLFGSSGQIEEAIRDWILYKTDIKREVENIKNLIFE